MPTFERSIVVDAPREKLFWWMQDYQRRLDWDPFLSEARLVDATKAAAGARAYCVDQRGRGMETIYVTFRPPERVAVEMTVGPWIFRKFAGAWIYRSEGEARTEVIFRYHVESRLRFGALGDFILSKIFAREMTARLTALRDAVNSEAFTRYVF
jgi:ribosome-associated toxin RatA of RatAB toxin-antitoxin module